MKRSLAITAATAMLALSLAGCGAQDGGDMDLLPDTDGGGYGTTAPDTLYNDGGMAGTGTTNGATANNDTVGNDLGSVTGAVNRSYNTGRNSGSVWTDSMSDGVSGTTYRDSTTGGRANGVTGIGVDYADDAAVRRAAVAGDRYARMLENARVHDSDGFLLDGENPSYRTF